MQGARFLNEDRVQYLSENVVGKNLCWTELHRAFIAKQRDSWDEVLEHQRRVHQDLKTKRTRIQADYAVVEAIAAEVAATAAVSSASVRVPGVCAPVVEQLTELAEYHIHRVVHWFRSNLTLVEPGQTAEDVKTAFKKSFGCMREGCVSRTFPDRVAYDVDHVNPAFKTACFGNMIHKTKNGTSRFQDHSCTARMMWWKTFSVR